MGGLLVVVGALLLLVLPDLVAGAGMLIGGAFVGAGFIWTMVSFYTGSETPPDA